LLFSLAFGVLAPSAVARTWRVTPTIGLQTAINSAANADTLLLSAGTYVSRTNTFVDSLCGNCEEHQTPVRATYGFRIRRKSLTVVGESAATVVLRTNSGYGVFIDEAPNVSLQRLTVTGGKRDADGNATDAGIVVRRSVVSIRNVVVRDNARTDTSVVVGICGIVGREGAELDIRNSVLSNNSWDGVALYRGSAAVISDCIIENGRGAGIGVTWDATCVALRNTVSGYWKGIGSFGSAWLMARNNLVRSNLGWGIVAAGESYLDATNNVIYANGNCGVAAWGSGSHGRFINNIISENGWREQWVCPCVGVWNFGDWAKWDFSHNIVWSNKDGEYRDIWDQTDFNGNLNLDPRFSDTLRFLLAPDSPGLNAGSAKISDLDGSTSDIGLSGGGSAQR
jgi:Right handed beta helix region